MRGEMEQPRGALTHPPGQVEWLPIEETPAANVVLHKQREVLVQPQNRAVILPEIAWRGLLGRYRDLVAPCTEAPEVFHLGSAIAAVGCLIGRKAWIVNPHNSFTNFYNMLVGRTGNTRKTTAYQFALKLLQDAGRLLETNVKQLNGLASVEGLAAAMQPAAPAQEIFRILCIEDEFRSLATKGKQKSVSNIIPKVTELYNCPPAFEVNTKKDPIRVPEPFLCMLTATTQAWFEESLSTTDVSGGFLNRWLLFQGEPEAELPFPNSIKDRAWDDLVQDICVAIKKAEGLFDFTEDAKGVYGRFYHAARRTYVSEATSRVDFHAKKLGLLYAILAGHAQIEQEDIESGIAVAEYCARVVEPLAAGIDVSLHKRLEDRLLDLVKHGPVDQRDGYRKLRVSAKDFFSASRSLQDMGLIKLEGKIYSLVEE